MQETHLISHCQSENRRAGYPCFQDLSLAKGLEMAVLTHSQSQLDGWDTLIKNLGCSWQGHEALEPCMSDRSALAAQNHEPGVQEQAVQPLSKMQGQLSKHPM